MTNPLRLPHPQFTLYDPLALIVHECRSLSPAAKSMALEFLLLSDRDVLTVVDHAVRTQRFSSQEANLAVGELLSLRIAQVVDGEHPIRLRIIPLDFWKRN